MSSAASKPIAVALSGGVDSATVAALLQRDGHQVIGLTMRLYDARDTPASIGGRCCGPRDIEDARQICARLEIPFYVVDHRRELERLVVDNFVDSYLRGMTPNPCARCNQYIKFGPLLNRARALGADRLATGHYARIDVDAEGRRILRRGRDVAKDQSYFLFALPAHELPSLRFPLGNLTKAKVRQLAAEMELPVADKGESQEICFVPDGDYASFVERRARASGREVPGPGPIVTLDGTEVGRHRGAHHYTVGQRRGLGAVGQGEPAYVVRVAPAARQVFVGPRQAAERTSFSIAGVQWLIPAPRPALRAAVQIRHRHRPVMATVEPGPDATASVRFDKALIVAPGQAAVMYDGDRVIGGGWIEPYAVPQLGAAE